ncbi:AraC family transcriptional regulator [Streptomyces telluris]|uniref:AraC family transcriptional regulator n=1 Tax=Streptomyces telluris TaxID=2720021 RepID=A0A9X2LH34_9ACTN|nr:AraC family transcriptional regulator [Streptomyces telluris]MCQ8770921.1 AraC family transcriptional regulator [Streptomyces telluris]NJP81935.1 AraC family transcriptional regulator [Streptomyces telluris]
MDPFDDLLRGVRANGAVFGGSVLSPPWALRFTDGAFLTLCAPLRGEGWLVPAEGGPRRLAAGETAIVRGPEPFVFTDDPSSAEGAAGPVREVSCGSPDAAGGRSDPVGEGVDGRTVLMAGAYRVPGEVPRRLLQVLPPVLVVPDGHHDCAPMRRYLEAQLAAHLPGRQIVVDRLLDWLLVCTLRDWFDRPEAASPAWYRALGDEVVGPVLRAMHDAPHRAWTLASLAAVAGVSRSTFAKRFHELLGEPPLAYLTEWRMTLAVDLLGEPGATLASVARRVGYADPFGFSTAFKRVRGVSPSAYRAGQKAADQPVFAS